MGIKTTQGGAGAVFYKINAKEGCFQQKVDGQTVKYEPGRTQLEGVLIDAKIDENEYEGVKSESLRLVFRDVEPGQPNMHVSFGISNGGVASSFGIKALAKVNAANFNEPFSLAPYFIAAGSKLGDITFDKDTTGVSVKQGGQKLVEDLGTPDNKLPECPTVIVNGKPFLQNGKEVKDRSPWEAVLDEQLKRLFDRIKPAETHVDGEDGVSVDDVAAGAAMAQQRARG